MLVVELRTEVVRVRQRSLGSRTKLPWPAQQSRPRGSPEGALVPRPATGGTQRQTRRCVAEAEYRRGTGEGTLDAVVSQHVVNALSAPVNPRLALRSPAVRRDVVEVAGLRTARRPTDLGVPVAECRHAVARRECERRGRERSAIRQRITARSCITAVRVDGVVTKATDDAYNRSKLTGKR